MAMTIDRLPFMISLPIDNGRSPMRMNSAFLFFMALIHRHTAIRVPFELRSPSVRTEADEMYQVNKCSLLSDVE